MKNKLNIEKIKYIIPDYISGTISDAEKILVENALKESPELREFCEDVKGTFNFVSNVKFEEPPAQYFNNLLPRIHEKIEARAAKRFAWSNIGAIWKIVIPVAAVLLVFIFYMLLRSPENQMTKKEVKQVEEIKKDTSKSEVPEIKEDKKVNIEQKIDNVSDNNRSESLHIKKNPKHQYKEKDYENTAENNTPKDDKSNDIIVNIQTNDEFASLDPDDISIFSTNPVDGIDDETETELNKLNNNEKDQLIEDLLKSNL